MPQSTRGVMLILLCSARPILGALLHARLPCQGPHRKADCCTASEEGELLSLNAHGKVVRMGMLLHDRAHLRSADSGGDLA